MAFPAEEHRIFVLGDTLEPDEINDIEAAIVRMAGLGQFDAEITALAGIDVPDGQIIALGDALNEALRFDESDPINIPAAGFQRSGTTTFDPTTGVIDFGASAASAWAPIIFPGGGNGLILSAICKVRRSTVATLTATLYRRTFAGVVTALASQATSNASNADVDLNLNVPVATDADIDAFYWLHVVASGVTGVNDPSLYGATIGWNRPS